MLLSIVRILVNKDLKTKKNYNFNVKKLFLRHLLEKKIA